MIETHSHMNNDNNNNSNNMNTIKRTGEEIQPTLIQREPIPKKSRIIKTDKPRPFLCPICTRGFVRHEHLKRHQRSHTREKPFLCIFCGRCFARKDLVIRHQQKLHSSLIEANNNNQDSNNHNNNITEINKINDLNNLSNETTNNIIKIAGNKETILPTPLIMNNSRRNSKIDDSNNNSNNNNFQYDNGSNRSVSLPSSSNGSVSGSISLPTSSKKSTSKSLSLPSNSNRSQPNYIPEIKNSDTSLNTFNSDIPLPVPMKRHASFSATNPLSYTRSKIDIMDHFNNNDMDGNNSVSDHNTSADDVPREVGFSTPQFMGQQLVDKAIESGLLDIDPLTLPPANLNENPIINNLLISTSNNGNNKNNNNNNAATPNNNSNGLNPRSLSQPIQSTVNNTEDSLSNITNLNNGNPLSQSFLYLSGLPSLTDMLTVGSTLGGTSGFNKKGSSARLNLNSFDYRLSNFPPPAQFPPPQSMLKKNISKRSVKTPLSMFTTIGVESSNPIKKPINEQISQMLKLPSGNTTIIDSSSTSSSHSNSQIASAFSSEKNNIEQPITNCTSIDPSDDQWLAQFLGENQNIGEYKINTKNFNEIGFYPSTSSGSGSSVSSTSSSNVSSPRPNQNAQQFRNSSNNNTDPNNYDNTMSNINAPPLLQKKNSHRNRPKLPKMKFPNLTTGISDYFTSRQLDMFKIQNEMNKLQQEQSDSSDSGEIELDFEFKSKHSSISSSGSHTHIPSVETHHQQQQSEFINKNANDYDNVIAQKYGVKDYRLFSEELRLFIIEQNRLDGNSFPTVQELNRYISLFEVDFGQFLHFIHIPTIQPNKENYPLLLSMAMIGALYAFHSSHTKLLFMITNTQIKKVLEIYKNNGDSHMTPLWILQTMTLLAFVGIFNNDLKIIKSMNPLLMSLIELIMINKVNLPLELTLQPPIPNNNIMDYEDNPEMIETIKQQYQSSAQMEKNFQYFILAQQRIRLCHSLLLISNFFASLVGLQCLLHSIDLKCGVPTYHEDLFQCENYEQWYEILQRKHINIDSKFSLIQLSNGDELFENCLMYLSNGDQYFLQNKTVSKLTLLSLMVSIHEKIYMERNETISKASINPNNSLTIQDIDREWRRQSRPRIDFMIRNWESLYLKNGGVIDISEQTIHKIDMNPMIRITLPLYYFAKVRRCIEISYAMNRIWLKDWRMMNKTLDGISVDWKALQEATEASLTILGSWISIVSKIQFSSVKNYDGKGGYRTPVTTISCMFVSICIVSEYLKSLEEWAGHNNSIGNGQSNMIKLNHVDKELYKKAVSVLKKIQRVLLPGPGSMKSYLEFLQIQTHKHIETLEELEDEDEVLSATSEDAPPEQTADLIRKLKLSSRALYLGVRILGDAPVWPIAIVFAHALQSRAIFNICSNTHDQR